MDLDLSEVCLGAAACVSKYPIHSRSGKCPHAWTQCSPIGTRRWAGYSTWIPRAEAALRANQSLFSADGRGSAADLYPLSSNGRTAAMNDAWANDQDWALVYWLSLADIATY